MANTSRRALVLGYAKSRKSLIKISRFVTPVLLTFPFIQSFYTCPFILPWVACNECPIFSCLMNPKTSPIRRILLANFPICGFLVGRAFCSWVCPYGMFQEIASILGNKARGIKRTKGMNGIRAFLAIITFLIAFSLAYPIILGFFPQLSTLSFILDPLYVSGISISSVALSIPQIVTFLRLFLFTFLLVTSVFLRRVWCRFCPLGTVISFFNKVSLVKLKVDKNKCDECHQCASFCQMDLRPIDNGLESIECIKCLDCIKECKKDAIGIKLRILNCH